MTAIIRLDHDRVWLKLSHDVLGGPPWEHDGQQPSQPGGRRHAPSSSPPATTLTTNDESNR
jgi:hypothetical protein